MIIAIARHKQVKHLVVADSPLALGDTPRADVADRGHAWWRTAAGPDAAAASQQPRSGSRSPKSIANCMPNKMSTTCDATLTHKARR